MSGRGENRGGESPHAWLRGALVVVVIAAALGVFGTQTRLQRPALGPVNIAGIAVMVVGLAVTLLSRRIAGALSRDADRAEVSVKLAGVLVCGVGAMLVFL